MCFFYRVPVPHDQILIRMAQSKMPIDAYIDIFVVDRLILPDLAENHSYYLEYKQYRKQHTQPGVMRTDLDRPSFERTKEFLGNLREVSDSSRARSTSTNSISTSSAQLAKNVSTLLETFIKSSHYSNEFRQLRGTKVDYVIPKIVPYVLLAMSPKSVCRFEFRFAQTHKTCDQYRPN